jgi:hypothetical protein
MKFTTGLFGHFPPWQDEFWPVCDRYGDRRDPRPPRLTACEVRRRRGSR